MNLISDEAFLYRCIQAVKRQGSEFVTNFYAAPNRVKEWIKDTNLLAVESGQALFVFRTDRDFYHLYFFAADIDALDRALTGSPAVSIEGCTVVTDIVGKGEETKRLQAVCKRHGFQNHISLFRMSRIAREPQASIFDDDAVMFARSSDAPKIVALMEASFDRYAEQLPTTAEIALAAGSDSILIVRRGQDIAGFLFFEVTGQTSILRYWLVAPGFRDQHVGSKLMQRYYRECAAVRRFLLWVIAGNDNAAKRYRHYGYQPDGLLDHVMIKKCP
jgi:ribosomal protein S18 acetylase RimI-like enzyme